MTQPPPKSVRRSSTESRSSTSRKTPAQHAPVRLKTASSSLEAQALHFPDSAAKTSLAELPNSPAIYALYAGHSQGTHVVFVSSASKLKPRITQHLDRRENYFSATPVVTLNPDYITEVRWWEHPEFDQRPILEAAEQLVAEALKPVLRFQVNLSEDAQRFYRDATFRKNVHSFLENIPSGSLLLLNMQDALEKIVALEQRIQALEKRA